MLLSTPAGAQPDRHSDTPTAAIAYLNMLSPNNMVRIMLDNDACPISDHQESLFMSSTVSPAWRIAAGLFGLTGVAMGAIAAHALSDPAASIAAERASLYQILHALALLYIANQPGRLASCARSALTLGVLFFCGGIYLKYMGHYPWAGSLAPYGGTAFMIGWLFIALARPTPHKP